MLLYDELLSGLWRQVKSNDEQTLSWSAFHYGLDYLFHVSRTVFVSTILNLSFTQKIETA